MNALAPDSLKFHFPELAPDGAPWTTAAPRRKRKPKKTDSPAGADPSLSECMTTLRV